MNFKSFILLLLTAALVTACAAPASSATGTADSGNQQLYAVTMTAYMMDTAGLHDMDTTLNEGGEIDSSWLGTVERLERLMAVTPWSPELEAGAAGLRETLREFAAALDARDVEAAKPLATQIHDEQHDFSHEVGNWINAQLGIEGGGSH